MTGKVYWVATKPGEIPIVAKYLMLLTKYEKSGYTIKRDYLPPCKYEYITVK